MRELRSVTGRVAVLDRTDVDTDQIIPARFIARVSRTGYDDALFADWRDQPDYFLRDQERVGATILLAGARFGVGSSREHAVWALQDGGFRVVLAPSFGDIFRNNAAQNGLLAAVIDEATAARLRAALATDPAIEVTVDLERTEVRWGSDRASFDVPDDVRQRLLVGADDISLTLAHESSIDEHERGRAGWLPRTTQPAG
jgi:3-isopropylmalate/(R)-2-methylmalate dehydratase small subunit